MHTVRVLLGRVPLRYLISRRLIFSLSRPPPSLHGPTILAYYIASSRVYKPPWPRQKQASSGSFPSSLSFTCFPSFSPDHLTTNQATARSIACLILHLSSFPLSPCLSRSRRPSYPSPPAQVRSLQVCDPPALLTSTSPLRSLKTLIASRPFGRAVQADQESKKRFQVRNSAPKNKHVFLMRRL